MVFINEEITMTDNFQMCLELTEELEKHKKQINEYKQKLKRKDQECEELKNELIDVKWKIEAQDIELNDNVEQLDQIKGENEKLKQTLAEIKPILEYYENSKIGEKQEDGSYKLEFTLSDIATPFCIKYDPKPAREALKKINEVEDDRT